MRERESEREKKEVTERLILAKEKHDYRTLGFWKNHKVGIR